MPKYRADEEGQGDKELSKKELGRMKSKQAVLAHRARGCDNCVTSS